MKEYTLITGACGGLGGAFVQLLAERGEPLFLTGRSEPRLTALSQSLKERFPSLPVQICACDFVDDVAGSAFGGLYTLRGRIFKKRLKNIRKKKFCFKRASISKARYLASSSRSKTARKTVKRKFLRWEAFRAFIPCPILRCTALQKKR